MKQKEDSIRLAEGRDNERPRSIHHGRVARVLDGEVLSPPPIWLMRQAGRYLPEYRAVRAKVGGFLELCFDPARAAEVTLQPVTRYDLDAAILFSDILVIPYALGRRVWFVEGEGPRLDPIDEGGIAALGGALSGVLAPVVETVRRVRAGLGEDKTLIGFCGAPWTVATYMIAGRGTPDQAPALAFQREHAADFQRLVDALVSASADYLVAQLRAGADVAQIFDSWAGVLGDDAFGRWSFAPTAAIVQRVKAAVPDARIIGFPKGIGERLLRYVEGTGVDGVSLDWTVPLSFARDVLQPKLAVQGNLDPKMLVAGGDAMDRAIDTILEALGHGRFIFNLGHGIVPETPAEHVARLVARVRAWRG